MKHFKGIGIIVLFLGLVSFTIFQTMQEDEELIVGTWIPEGCSECEWIFTDDGKCYDYYEGKLDNTYTYSIRKSRASNGVVFSYLKIVKSNDSNDTYEYDIN